MGVHKAAQEDLWIFPIGLERKANHVSVCKRKKGRYGGLSVRHLSLV